MTRLPVFLLSATIGLFLSSTLLTETATPELHSNRRAAAAGAVYPVTVDPVYTQVKKLVVGDGVAYDHFGYSVAIDGDTAVVGAKWYSTVDYSDMGAAYIFSRNEGGANNWGQVAKLTASDGAAGDEFGISVGISGDTVVVGAWGKDTSMTVVDTGAAYIFSRNQGGTNAWGQVKKLTAGDSIEGQDFGISVGISGETVVVGAYEYDESAMSAVGNGAAYIFSRNAGGTDAWGQVKKLTASDGALGDRFGYSVAIDADTTVVGAYFADAGGSDSGAAYMYYRDQGGMDAWGQVAKLTAGDGAADDYFGISVGIDGDTVVVGAESDDDKGAGSGSAYIFYQDEGGTDAWGQVKKLTASDGAGLDFFGHAVAVRGDIVVAGAPLDDDKGDSSGSAYIFSRNQGGTDAWGQVEKFTAGDGAAKDDFGIAVSLSGNTVVVGAYLDDDKGFASGSAYIGGISIVQTTTTTVQSTTTTSVAPTTTTTVQPTTTTSGQSSTTTTSTQPTTTTTTSVSSSTTIRQSTTTSVIITTTSVANTTTVLLTTTIQPTTTSSTQSTTTVQPTTTTSIMITTSVPTSTTTSIRRLCPVEELSADDHGKISLMRQYRDKVLRKTPTGRAYVRLFYRHALEVTAILVKNPALAAEARNMLNTMEPEVKESVQGRAVTIRQPELDGINSILNAISSEAGPDLKKSIHRIKRDLQQKRVVGKIGIKINR